MTSSAKKYVGSLILCLCFAATISAQGQAGPPEVSAAVWSDVSPDLATLASMSGDAGDATSLPFLSEMPEPEGEVPDPLFNGERPDPVVQVNQFLLGDVRASLSLNFSGLAINAAGGGNVTPPDPNGAVGLTQYVQWVNLAFAVYDKATGNLVFGPFKGNTLWANFGGDCQTLNSGDPIVAYDKLANRWVLTQFAINSATGQGSECIAISTTPDATGPYFRYQFSYGQFVDYPKIGVWPDAYYVTYNVFSFATGNPYLGPKFCALQRANMLLGLPANQVCFQLSTSFFSVLPADMDGTIPPAAGAPELLMSQDSNFSPSSILNLWKFHVDFGTPANSTLALQTINVAPYSDPCLGFTRGACIPQPSTMQRLESITVHLMHRLPWRMSGGREELLANHTIVAGSSTGIRWYEIRNPSTAPIVFQQGTFAPDSSYRWLGSVAMDKMGNIGLGYSVSDDTGTFPSIRFTGRLRTELRNIMETEATVKAGQGSATGSARWGDYSAITLDPTDDCTFWYTNEYFPTTTVGFWATQIANFKFPNCN